jgi:hypothetical protein
VWGSYRLRSFDRLLGLLSEIPDPRRGEGKLYQLPCVLLFSILAVVTGGKGPPRNWGAGTS